MRGDACVDDIIVSCRYRLITSDCFEHQFNALQLYIADDAVRPVSVNLAVQQQLRDKLLAIKLRTHRGFFERVKSKPSLLRSLIGFEGQEYYQWNTAAILLPSVFDEFEWLCFLHIFNAVESDPEFKRSSDYAAYAEACAADERQREADLRRDYDSYRMMKFKIFSKEFKSHEDAMSSKAGEVVDVVMKRLIDRLYFLASRKEVHHRTIELRHEEQEIYEESEMCIEEALFFTEEHLLDNIFDFYVRSMINHMLELPGCRKGLLQYAGLLRANMTKRLTLAEAKAATEQEDWFGAFFEGAKNWEVAQYNITTPQETEAAKRIQARFRGVLARNTARSAFVQMYNKVYDEEYQAYYYFNSHTGESSWVRPYITERLFTYLNW